ncbi:MAG: transcription termination/antitermination NusG family protein [Verrucomicrobiota bacterium]|nr:transcription termination/antitermination NusG family protein [Verrucomicrobiota bacterium]
MESTNEIYPWYCLRSQTRHENVAAVYLRSMGGVDVFCPRIRFKKASRGQAVWMTEAMFPGYLFARFEPDSMLPRVRHAHGVIGIVHFGLRYASVDSETIDDLRKYVGDSEVGTIEPEFKVGDTVKLSGGAMNGLRAVITQVMSAKNRIKVLMDFLGRSTEVEIDTHHAVVDQRHPLAV